VEIVQPTNSWIKNAQRTAEAEAEAATASYKFNPKNKNYRFPVDASEFYFSNIAQSLTYRIAKGFFQTPNTKLEYKLDFPEPGWDHYFYKITEKKGKKRRDWILKVESYFSENSSGYRVWRKLLASHSWYNDKKRLHGRNKGFGMM